MLKIVLIAVITAALSLATNLVSNFIQPSADNRKKLVIFIFIFLVFLTIIITLLPESLNIKTVTGEVFPSPFLLPVNADTKPSESLIPPVSTKSPTLKPSTPLLSANPSISPSPTSALSSNEQTLQSIAFSTAEKPTKLRQDLFKWEQGGLSGNAYSISGNVLKITAAAGTDAFPNTEPRVIYSVHDDFEAIVKVRFSSNTNYQRATLGVRSVNGGSGLIRIYMLEGQRIEAGFYPENNNRIPDNITGYPYDVAYLRIDRKNAVFNAFYSSNKVDWHPILKRSMSQNLQELEIFLSVLSTDVNEGCVAEFSDFMVRQL